MKKIISYLIVLIMLIVFPLNIVSAYSGDLDTEDYITFPYLVTGDSGKITVSDSVEEEYELYYQVVMLDADLYAQIDEAITEENTEEYKSLLPDFEEDNWVQTEDGNFSVDLSEYSGEVNYCVWAKIVIQEQPYYDAQVYSSLGTKEPAQDTEKTDFSNATFELKKEGVSDAILEIKGAELKEDRDYYIMVTDNASEPEITRDIAYSSDIMSIEYNEETNSIVSLATDDLAQYVELNKDMYVSVIEYNHNTFEYTVASYGTKITKYNEPTYNKAFFATFMASTDTQIITQFTHGSANDRKFELKVGKITDTSILQKIKNSETEGMQDLLTYSKSDKGIYDKNFDVTGSSDIEYLSYENGDKIIDLNGLLEDDEYYYLYVKTDDENGEYISNEAVTLAKANVYTETKFWSLFFYGSDDFSWTEFSGENLTQNNEKTTTKKDDTITTAKTLPYTGKELWITVSIVILGGVRGWSHHKNKMYKDIK